MRFYIQITDVLFPLKKWIKDNSSSISGYKYSINDNTHQIVGKLIKLGWDRLEIQNNIVMFNVVFSNKTNVESKAIMQVDKDVIDSQNNFANEEYFRHLYNPLVESNDINSISFYLKMYLDSIQKLKELKVINTRRDFTSQLGEWFVSKLVNGEISANGIQKDWDINANGNLIQVKSHSKANTTSARWSEIKYKAGAKIDFIAIVVFDLNYRVEEFYFLSWSDCLPLIRNQKHQSVLNWRDIINFRVDLNKFKQNEIISMFIQ